jgi:hypothetical protein
MGAVHLLLGTTFANVTKKGGYRSEKAAALTLPELERWLALQIAGVYHHSVHSALRQPPAMAWENGLVQRARPPRHPQDRERFFLDFGCWGAMERLWNAFHNRSVTPQYPTSGVRKTASGSKTGAAYGLGLTHHPWRYSEDRARVGSVAAKFIELC